jgi:ubiquinone/menaquinone biosynthesis C-methylase UbiE
MSFDHLAPFYQAIELIAAGGKLQCCRTAFLAEIPVPHTILLVGEGHGKFLTECLKHFPEAEIVIVDVSARMLEISKNKIASEHVRFIHADFLEWNGQAGGFDLIVTNFFLDCFSPDQLTIVVSKLGRLARPGAHWLLADFEVPSAPVAQLRSRVILAILYGFFRIVTGLKARSLSPPDADLERAGFTRHRRITRDWGMLKSEWWRRSP